MLDAYLGEFRRGPAVFTVFRFDRDSYRVECNDGNGPSPVCGFTDRTGDKPHWHGAWNGDRWCAWIEAEARKVIKNPEQPTG
ncbi:hypothetical protein [Glycomyces salinus]|uniref:hypothetical protein n=1 Tax=Glycomyces salinus TaxID=980294 RepID=UPI0018EDF57F|nr:hypothetical protein [Glycomyces salinus]